MSILTSIGYDVASLEEVRQHAPAAFAEHKSPERSEKYSFVSTADLLRVFERLGWSPTYARQNGSGPYARHVVRLNNPDLGFMDLKTDRVKPQFILDNSHDGSSPAQGHLGLFRLVCTNGLVVSMPGMYTSIKLRHIGIDVAELKNLMEAVAEQYTVLGKHIGDMQQHELDEPQREEFVVRAMAAREPWLFVRKEDGTVDTEKVVAMVKPSQILEPIRGEDKKEDLWTLFNVVQERLVKGEFDRRMPSGRRSRPRTITNATRGIDFNRRLWEIAESYMLN